MVLGQTVESERCWRLGLIVAELVTNAVRHAFKGRRGTIRVEIRQLTSLIQCRVTDNGVSGVEALPGPGLQIVRALVESLDGTIDHHFGPNSTAVALTFPFGS